MAKRITHRETATYAEYARHRGVTQPIVTGWKRTGQLVMRDGRVDVIASDALLDGDPRSAPVNGSDKMSRHDAATLKENYLARLRQLEYDLKSGALVDAETVSRTMFEKWRAERDAWLNWPARVAPLLAAKFGINANELVIDLEARVRQHITERAESP